MATSCASRCCWKKFRPACAARWRSFRWPIACFAIGYLAFWATRFSWESYEFNDMASGMLAIPLWIPQTTFVAGSWLFFIAVLDEMVLVARGARPTYVTAVEERHAHGDFSSDI